MTDKAPWSEAIEALTAATGRHWYTLGCAKSASGVMCPTLGAKLTLELTTLTLATVGTVDTIDVWHPGERRMFTAEEMATAVSAKLAGDLKLTGPSYEECVGALRRILKRYRALETAGLVEEGSILARSSDRLVTRYGFAMITRASATRCAIDAQVHPNNLEMAVERWSSVTLPRLTAWAEICRPEAEAFGLTEGDRP
jgi:hypothetical protein